MIDNKNLLLFLQELIYGLVDFISEKEYKEFVFDSLKLSKQELDKESGFVHMIYTIDWKIWMSRIS